MTSRRPLVNSRIARGMALACIAWFGAEAPPLAAQTQFLETALPTGQPVAPFFEGWYANPDGTYTFSFGYHNFNTEETVHIPFGPDNRLEPARFDLREQPTLFPAGSDRRERGVFTVTVPGDFGARQEPVVWYLTAYGTTYTVPARIGVDAYQLDYAPRAGGSVAPLLGFEPDGPRGQDPRGIAWDRTLTTSVGEPLSLSIWASDPSERPDDATRPDAGVEIPLGLTLFTHSGPGVAEFEQNEGEVGPRPGGAEASWTTTVKFNQPGDYVLRVRADNWTARDSSSGNQCCWTNGYVRVSVGS